MLAPEDEGNAIFRKVGYLSHSTCLRSRNTWILKYISLESDNEYLHLKWERSETDELQNICKTLQWIIVVEKEMCIFLECS